jgi:predicted metal-dependent hydrolase
MHFLNRARALFGISSLGENTPEQNASGHKKRKSSLSLTTKPDVFFATHQDQRFEVHMRRSSTAKRMTLRISSATRTPVLTMPLRATPAMAQIFITAHAGWIAARLHKMPDKIPFVVGNILPVRGVPHKIVQWSRVSSPVLQTVDDTGQPILAVSGEARHIKRRVIDFLKREALADLRQAVLRHTHTLGIPARSISLKDTRSRWGSCSAQGNLNFSWRLIFAPPLVLDYLAAHEVAHLKEMNHSDRFWALTHQLCLHTDAAEKWLKKHGSSLHRYG